VQWLSVDEAKLAVQLAPASALYLYAEGRAFAIGDSNRGWSTAAGTGLDLVRLAGSRWPLQAYLRWDAYFTGFAEARSGYYSPGFQDGHSPGLDLRLRVGDAVTLGLEGGRTFALFSDSRAGWFGGGQAQVRVGRLSFAAHAQVRDDPWYGSRRFWATLRAEL